MEINGVAALSAGSTYWTAERRKAAKERALFQDGGITAQVAGTSNLDFTRSRITPRSANLASPYKAAGGVQLRASINAATMPMDAKSIFHVVM